MVQAMEQEQLEVQQVAKRELAGPLLLRPPALLRLLVLPKRPIPKLSFRTVERLPTLSPTEPEGLSPSALLAELAQLVQEMEVRREALREELLEAQLLHAAHLHPVAHP